MYTYCIQFLAVYLQIVEMWTRATCCGIVNSKYQVTIKIAEFQQNILFTRDQQSSNKRTRDIKTQIDEKKMHIYHKLLDIYIFQVNKPTVWKII